MPVSLRSGAARRILIWGVIVLVLVAAYAGFGFYGVPALIRSQGSAFVTQKYQRTLQLGAVHFNPFTLELDVRDFAFPDADGKPEYHYVLIDYLCRRLSGEPTAASDASRVEWVAEENLRQYRLTEGTLGVIERAFAKLQR